MRAHLVVDPLFVLQPELAGAGPGQASALHGGNMRHVLRPSSHRADTTATTTAAVATTPIGYRSVCGLVLVSWRVCVGAMWACYSQRNYGMLMMMMRRRRVKILLRWWCSCCQWW
jgi:hypothetical protein